MTIQFSVTLWTVICLVLLMLILHNLLFKPMLRVMDARREKIDKAAAKKAEWEKAEREYEMVRLEKEAAFLDEQKRRVRDEIEDIRAAGKKKVDYAKEERLRLVDEYRRSSEAEHEEILGALGMHTAELAAAFADSLTKE